MEREGKERRREERKRSERKRGTEGMVRTVFAFNLIQANLVSPLVTMKIK